VDLGSFGQVRRLVVKNLTPGTVYTVQVRAVGGSTGQAPRCDRSYQVFRPFVAIHWPP